MDPSVRNEILIITDRRFWRRSIGSEQRIATLILHLARRGEPISVAYVGRANRREQADLDRFVASTANLVVLTRPFELKTLWQTLRKRARRKIFPTPTDDITVQNSPARRAFVQSVIEKRRPRIVIVEFLRLTYTVDPRGPQTLGPEYWIDTHDVLHQRTERYRAAGATVLNPTAASQEVQQLETYDTILAIQKPEGELLRHLVPTKLVIVVPHGVELSALPNHTGEARRPTRLGFLGGRDESNRRALDWFVEKIWPGIRSRFREDIELHVAGQICQDWHEQHEGLVSVGPLASIDDFWPNIDIAINPIQFGSGLKIKNVEALAYGRPLITTSIGAEGLEEASPNGLRIADSEFDWQRVLDEWISDPAAAAETGRAGHAYAKDHLSEDAAFHDLCQQIAETFSEAGE